MRTSEATNNRNLISPIVVKKHTQTMRICHLAASFTVLTPYPISHRCLQLLRVSMLVGVDFICAEAALLVPELLQSVLISAEDDTFVP